MSKPSKINNIFLSTEELDEYLKSYSRIDICNFLNISMRTLDRLIKKKGLTKINHGPKRLNQKVIEEIRILYKSKKYKQKQIAEKFEVSQSLVSKIINNEIHKDYKKFKLGGQAAVRIGYKYGN